MPYISDNSQARLVGEYLEKLIITEGSEAGKNLKLMPWQKAWLKGALAPDVVTSAISVPRTNAKSTTSAGVACAAFDGPLAQNRAPVLLLASSLEQSRILFQHCKWFLRPRLDKDPRRYTVRDSVNVAQIIDHQTDSKIICRASDPDRLAGTAFSLAVIDEMRSIKPPERAARLWAILETGIGKLEQSRIWAIGTKPSDHDHIFNRLLAGDADFSMSYSVPENSALSIDNFRRANPAWNYLPSLRAAIKREAKSARRSASSRLIFDAMRFNSGSDEIRQSKVLTVAEFQAIAVPAKKLPDISGGCVWGVDLSSGAAQSAVACYWPGSPGRVDVMAAFPERPSLSQRGHADGVDNAYHEMHRAGDLHLIGSRVVDNVQLLQLALKRFGSRPIAIYADRFRFRDLCQASDEVFGRSDIVIARGMGFIDGAKDMDSFTKAAVSRDIRIPDNALVRHSFAAANRVQGVAGDWKLQRRESASSYRQMRDDAAAAIVLAVGNGYRLAQDVEADSRRSRKIVTVPGGF